METLGMLEGRRDVGRNRQGIPREALQVQIQPFLQGELDLGHIKNFGMGGTGGGEAELETLGMLGGGRSCSGSTGNRWPLHG